MAKRVERRTLGIDVAKDELMVYDWDEARYTRVRNEPEALNAWLCGLDGPVDLALEPTSSFHLACAELACEHGHTVYPINPRQLAHYREGVNLRHKSDPDDAWLLARFLAKERTELRPYCRQDRRLRALWALIKRRAGVVQARRQLQQSLADTGVPFGALMTQFQALLARIDRRLRELIEALGWQADYRRCRSIPGIGKLNAAALLCAYHRGSFSSADAFIAFLGLDIRRRESGRYKGQQKLTKRGDAELRRLLYCAARPARSHAPFEQFYQRQLDKGLPKTAANLILGRKLARIAFALLSSQQSFDKNYGLAP